MDKLRDVAHIVVFHSVFGRRPVEARAAARLRAAGHDVAVPDLFDGQTAATHDNGFAIVERVGWDTVVRRAVDAVPPGAVLMGFSMGAGVIEAVARQDTPAVLLFHAPARVPAGVPAQLHVADPDVFAPPEVVATLAYPVFTYPGVGHFFTDEDLPDHDAAAADLAWRRAIAFLSAPA